MPESDQYVARIHELVAGGHAAQALDLTESALVQLPENPELHLLRATLLAKSGNPDRAIETLERLVALDPRQFDGWSWLAMLHRSRKQLDRSAHCADQALRLRPLSSQAHTNRGLTFMDAYRLADAARDFTEALRLDPMMAANHELLGKARLLQGQDALAQQAFQQGERLLRDAPGLLLGLAQASLNLNDYSAAAHHAERLLAKEPGNTVARLVLAGALMELGQVEQAERHLSQATQAAPSALGFAYLGMSLLAMGRLAESETAFRRSIELEPEQGLAYCALLRNRKVTQQDADLIHTMSALVQKGTLNPRGLAFLHYGLGKAFHDLGNFERAIRQFDRANLLARTSRFGETPFDPARLEAFVAWSCSQFTQPFISQNTLKDDGARPIFIVGMMRSGTTLLEQMLSAHPSVEAAGERSFWIANSSSAMRVGASSLDANRLQSIRYRYVAELRERFPDASRITDKMPGNYRHLGLLACAFPNSRVVHMRRHPIDTCLSIWMTPNRIANDFANDRAAIVFAYRQYDRLMRHWAEVLSPAQLQTLRYEQLVAEPEPQLSATLRFLDLTWNDACLHYEQNRRIVATPSVWQVRQPLYSTAIDRWRSYEPWLGEFAELLDLAPPLG